MRKYNYDSSLGDVLQKLFDAYGWTEKMDGVRITNSWEKVVGGIFAKHTTNMYVKNKKLFVFLDSSVLRNELYMERSEIVKKLNLEIGKKVITEIVFG
jgi:predicted nucleic acid-binding Zn ribbon protein